MNRCIMFDLDGTLIDSRADIVAAVNATRRLFGMEELPFETAVSYTGDGVRKLMERTFANTDVDIDMAIPAMNKYYAEHSAVYTRPYPGVPEGLEALRQKGWFTGVVSNKPTELCHIILKELGIDKFCCEILGGNSGFPLKPAPDALFYLMDKFGAAKEDSWFCGDNHTDMNAAKNAGIHSVFAAYGFGELSDSVYDVKIENFSDLLKVLE